MQNCSQQDPAGDYYTREKSLIEALLPPGQHAVLDVGCAAGAFGRRLLRMGKAEVVYGIEIFEEAAHIAAADYKDVRVGDLETVSLEYPCRFDYIVCGDILEHLREPGVVLSKLRNLLKDSGQLICTLPNVRNFRVVRDLVFAGEWRYRESGILDHTHLRFFTRRSAIRFLETAGFSVTSTRMLIYGPKKKAASAISFGLLDEFLATQVLLVATSGKDPS